MGKNKTKELNRLDIKTNMEMQITSYPVPSLINNQSVRPGEGQLNLTKKMWDYNHRK